MPICLSKPPPRETRVIMSRLAIRIGAIYEFPAIGHFNNMLAPLLGRLPNRGGGIRMQAAFDESKDRLTLRPAVCRPVANLLVLACNQ
uniref:Uncharacterized protein n=1 Tax=Rhodopseudomonas palustris (strain BisA53) TaxID=316055 RepID=Q07KY5_RHOP5